MNTKQIDQKRLDLSNPIVKYSMHLAMLCKLKRHGLINADEFDRLRLALQEADKILKVSSV